MILFVLCICIFGLVTQKYYQSFIFFKYCQDKPCFNMEMDSKTSTQNYDSKRKRIYQFIVDEAIIRVGSELIWLWVAIIEPAEKKQILALNVSKERDMFVAERLLSKPIHRCKNHAAVSTEMEALGIPKACKFLTLSHPSIFSFRENLD